MTLVEAVQATIRRLHYSLKTDEAYIHWIRAFIRFHNRRHPREMRAPDRRTSASSQNQALCALVFLYRRVLELDLPDLDGLQRAKRPEHLPDVLSALEVAAMLARLVPPFHLMGQLLHGSGLRLMECVSLWVKDIDFERQQIMVRRGKGNHDRVALLPAGAAEELRAQIDAVGRLHRCDLERGLGEADLPEGPRTKMPHAARNLRWQYLFPASRPCTDPATDRPVRHHIHETAMIYTHVVDRGPLGVIYPLDRLAFAAPIQIPHVGSLGVPGPALQAGSVNIRRRDREPLAPLTVSRSGRVPPAPARA